MTPKVILNATGLSKSYSSTLLFQALSLTVHECDHLGLIGPNGSGKSTLLKILGGLETHDDGILARSSGMHIAYLPQVDHFPEGYTVGQVLEQNLPLHLEPWERQKRLNDMQAEFSFPDLEQPCDTLSGGWRKRLALAGVLAREADLLLLDEPSNHLDLGGILWLESFLKNAGFAYILISHDRFLLENTCNGIVELNPKYPQGSIRFPGAYARFLEQRETYFANMKAAEVSLSNQVRREIEWLKRGPKARTTKAQSRIDKAHSMISTLSDLKERNQRATDVELDFNATDRRSKKLLHAVGLGLQRGGRSLFRNLEIFLSPGNRLGIMGANGSGKSSLIEVLRGGLQPDQGTIELAQNIQIQTLDQNRSLPDAHVSLRKALAPDGDTVIYQGNGIHINAWAQRFLFQKEQLDLPIGQLSGGERARVLLANLMRRPADILILDEPTNDLDIPTLEVLEDSFQDFNGALILISHDRYLMDRVCDQILYLDGQGETRVFADTWQLSQYQQSLMPQIAPGQPEAKASQPVDNKLRRQRLKEIRSELGKTERAIAKLEQRQTDIQADLLDPAYATDSGRLGELSRELTTIEDDLLRLLEKWESLETDLQELNG